MALFHTRWDPQAGMRFVARLAAAAGVVSLTLLSGCATPADRAKPLYQQLGGEPGIQTVVGQMLERVAVDPRTRRTFEGVRLSFLKDSVSDYVCHIADGPCVYEGETMKNSHADLGLGGSEFDVMVQVLREELDRAGVSTAAKNELLRRLAPQRRDIVTR